jgi:hypothetical protein
VDATRATDNTEAGRQQGAYVKAALGPTTPVLAMLDLQPGVSVGDQRRSCWHNSTRLGRSSALERRTGRPEP